MRRKYFNKKTKVDDIVFDSKKEANYYVYLKELLSDGLISNLQLQVKYELLPAIWGEETIIKHLKTKDKEITKKYCKQRPVIYTADFVYIDNKTGQEEVIDVKGGNATKTKEYRLKKKMMLALKGIEIIEV